MSADAALEVKVIFDASSRGRRPGKVGPVTRRRSRTAVWVLLGLINLVAAGAAYGFTWWKADPFLYMTLLMHSPVPGVSLSDVNRAFENAPGAQPLGGLLGEIDPIPQPEPQSAPGITGMKATTMIGITAYAWLTVATIAACLLAMSSGSLLGRAGGTALRRAGLILFFGALLFLAFGAYQTFSEYGRHYQPKHLRIGMGGLGVLALLLGMPLAERTRGLARLAGLATILGGGATAAALYIGYECGAIKSEYATPTFLAMIFVGVSLWGWLLLPLGSRWAR